MRKHLLSLLLLAGLLGGPFYLGAGEPLKSGPQPGKLLPGSFHPFNLNGEHKDKYHCLVCEYGLKPVVLVFARDYKDPAVIKLLDSLEDAVKKEEKKSYLKSFVVFLSKGATSSATEAKPEPDANKLVEEEASRAKLTKELQGLASKYNRVILSYYPEAGPKGYELNPDAAVTILVYYKQRVLDNFVFGPGELKEKQVEEFRRKLDTLLTARNVVIAYRMLFEELTEGAPEAPKK
jgi:hypothetical protein